MQDDTQMGWYALYLSITQNISPSRAMAALEGRRKGLHRLSWEEFVRVYRQGEAKIRNERRQRCSTERYRNYQKEYRRLHPLSDEQRRKRAEYLRNYRQKKRPSLTEHTFL